MTPIDRYTNTRLELMACKQLQLKLGPAFEKAYKLLGREHALATDDLIKTWRDKVNGSLQDSVRIESSDEIEDLSNKVGALTRAMRITASDLPDYQVLAKERSYLTARLDALRPPEDTEAAIRELEARDAWLCKCLLKNENAFERNVLISERLQVVNRLAELKQPHVNGRDEIAAPGVLDTASAVSKINGLNAELNEINGRLLNTSIYFHENKKLKLRKAEIINELSKLYGPCTKPIDVDLADLSELNGRACCWAYSVNNRRQALGLPVFQDTLALCANCTHVSSEDRPACNRKQFGSNPTTDPALHTINNQQNTQGLPCQSGCSG